MYKPDFISAQLFWCFSDQIALKVETSVCMLYVTCHDIVFCNVMAGTVAVLQAHSVELPVGRLWFEVRTLDQG